DQQACGVPEAVRRAHNADDDCASCHMPTAPTDIPHFAFTHHRIAIHEEVETPGPRSVPQRLVPLADIGHLSQLDQDRCLGLAYVQVSDMPEHVHHGEHYRGEALRILAGVRRRGMRDSTVEAALARLYWSIDPRRTCELARADLDASAPHPDDYAKALIPLTSHSL